ncbi:MAG: ferredoxin [Eubacteriales bacterium]|nr:ferredoxin [Eubacteriales bacterium]
MKVTIDRSGCIGCGLCASLCPEVFAMADDGLAEVISEDPQYADGAQQAAEECPVSVIHVEE